MAKSFSSTKTSVRVHTPNQTETENNGAKVPVMEGLKGRKRMAAQVRSALLS